MAPYLRTLVAIVAALTASVVSSAAPFDYISNRTLREDIFQATMVFVATPLSSVFDAKSNGTTVLRIESVIKSHAMIGVGKSVTINRYIPIEKTNPRKLVVFCDVTKGQLDAYSAIPCEPNSKVAEYLAGAWKVHDQNVQSKLAFFFKYLDSPEETLSRDALQEFFNVSYKDLSSTFALIGPV